MGAAPGALRRIGSGPFYRACAGDKCHGSRSPGCTVPKAKRKLRGASPVSRAAGTGERDATEAWRLLPALSRPNVCIIEGRLSNWLAHTSAGDPCLQPVDTEVGEKALAFTFEAPLAPSNTARIPIP